MLVQPFLPPHGEGPGAITPDGCAVDVYLALPYGGELERLAAYLPPHASVLELGCGCGRVTRRLVEAGFAVTAVDSSAAMLRHVSDAASKVDCHIERLDLGRTFEVVLLGSNLVNTPDLTIRDALLRSCRRHAAPDGRLLFERHDPVWLRSAEAGPVPPMGAVQVLIERVVHRGELVDMSVRYAIAAAEWKQHFTARILEDDEAWSALRQAGFSNLEWIDKRWGAARA